MRADVDCLLTAAAGTEREKQRNREELFHAVRIASGGFLFDNIRVKLLWPKSHRSRCKNRSVR
jgi:hypothetical protein